MKPFEFMRVYHLKLGIFVDKHVGSGIIVDNIFKPIRGILSPVVKHRHAKRARVIFLVIGVFVELFTVMVRLSFFWLRCTARRKLEIYNL